MPERAHLKQGSVEGCPRNLSCLRGHGIACKVTSALLLQMGGHCGMLVSSAPCACCSQVDHVKAERNVLAEVHNSHVVRLFYSFQARA